MSWTGAQQDALGAEHAAVWLYGLLGGQTSGTSDPALLSDLDAAYAAHRARRDELETMLRARDVRPVVADPAYAAPTDLSSPAAVEQEALRVERACATTYAWLVENSPSSQRRWAVLALNETAVRELAFQGTPEMLPGSDEYADR